MANKTSTRTPLHMYTRTDTHTVTDRLARTPADKLKVFEQRLKKFVSERYTLFAAAGLASFNCQCFICCCNNLQ